MKTKRVLTILFCLFFTVQLILSNSNMIHPSGSKLMTIEGFDEIYETYETFELFELFSGNGLIGGESPSGEPQVVPVSDSVLFLVFLTSIYGMLCIRKRLVRTRNVSIRN
jgi:hypothetical protein